MKTATDEAIRIEAYLLSEKSGHPAGMEAYFWQEAELIVASRAEKAPVKRLAAKAKPKSAVAAKAVAAKKAKRA